MLKWQFEENEYHYKKSAFKIKIRTHVQMLSKLRGCIFTQNIQKHSFGTKQIQLIKPQEKVLLKAFFKILVIYLKMATSNINLF